MARDYLFILIQIAVALGFAAFALVFSVIIGRAGKRSPDKDMAYECGMRPEGEGHSRFSVKFYLVAMLFILFDIEIVFMYPWALVYRDFITTLGTGIFWSMLSFVSILMVGYVYALRKGAFDWRR